MTQYRAIYDQRYQIKDNEHFIDAENIDQATQIARQFAVDNSPTNFDFSNICVYEQFKKD